MGQRLLGQETEYGLSVMRRSGAGGESESVAEELVRLAAMTPHLPAMRSSGLFLANGSRFYVDCGAHPELATPECTNPWDVVRYLRAGDQMLLDLTEQLRNRNPRIARAMILKNNVDYTTRATWGCHESYLHRIRGQAILSRQIIPHLVSRIVFTGAGGFDSFSQGLDFMVSPRVAFLRKTVAGESTNGRGIFHTKDEPLCGDGYHRLHVLCGESLCSDTAAWLKVATTALVVALIEAGKCPVNAMDLADPVVAMRTFADDPSCSRTAELTNHRAVSALEIQSHFLTLAEAHEGEKFMPPWAGEVCRHWRAMLDRLRQMPLSTGRTLDWAIKLALFENHARRRNTTLQALAKWTPVLSKFSTLMGDAVGGETALTEELLLSRRQPFAAVRKTLAPQLAESGLSWERLPEFFKVRLEMFELDTRFGLLGEGGLFAALDAAHGALDHRFPGVDNFSHARENPPANGRAAIRGACIRRVAGQDGRFAAEWDGVWDLEAGSALNLSDPFCALEKWEPSRGPVRDAVNPDHLFRIGRYAEMLEHDFHPFGLELHPENAVLAYARLGRVDESLALLDSLAPGSTECHPVALRMSVLSNGFVPAAAEMESAIVQAEHLLAEEPAAWSEYSRFVFHSYKALHFLHKNLPQLAEPLLVSLVGDAAHAARSRMCSRNRCHLAELYRRLGRTTEATELAKAAERTHNAEGLSGDMAAYSAPMLAKLARDDEEARLLLDLATITHKSQHNRLGLAHALCIRARRLHDGRDQAQIAALQQIVPVLAKCEVAKRIVREWDSWIAPELGDGPLDYWGL